MKAVLVSQREVAPEVRHFVFEIPEVERFEFRAGQFVSLSAGIGGKTITRAYSLASRAAGDNRFELCLNRVEGGLFSPHLFDLLPGGAVDVAGPLGYFHWRDAESDSILVATGTGIAPFRGMLQEDFGGQATLIFGVRFESSLMYREEFEALEAARPGAFRFQPVLSRGGEDWQGRRGHVQKYVIEALGDRRDVNVYICGMKAMVDDLRTQLKGLGLDRKRIIYEKYD